MTRSRGKAFAQPAIVARPQTWSAVVRRNSDGSPTVTSSAGALPTATKMALTRAERKQIGLWDGDLVRDAEGLKRVTLLKAGHARAEDDLRAAADLSIDGKVYRLSRRFDAPAGATFNFTAED